LLADELQQLEVLLLAFGQPVVIQQRPPTDRGLVFNALLFRHGRSV